MSQFGEHLIAKGVATEAQIEEAVRFKAVYGGRIGTALCDLGYLMQEELAVQLSDFHSVPLPPPEWLDAPEEKAIQVIPLPLIRRAKVLPLKLESSKIHVAMLDPTDREQLDFLEMASARSVVPYVLPEARLVYWLEIHLEIDRHPRFLGMITRPRAMAVTEEELDSSTPMLTAHQRVRVMRSDHTEDANSPAPAESAASENIELDLAAAFAPESQAFDKPELAYDAGQPDRQDDADEEILLLEDLVSEPQSAPKSSEADTQKTSKKAAAALDPSSHVARLESQLEAAADRDEVVRIALELARVYSRGTALFLVRSAEVVGFRAFETQMHERLQNLEIPITTPSIFTHPAGTRMPFRGPPPSDGIDGRLIDMLGRSDVEEVFVHPIIIRDRAVNLLYADNGADVFGETSIAALTALCDCLSRAYQRIITDQKRANRPAPGQADQPGQAAAGE